MDQLFLFFVSDVWVHIFCIGGKTNKSKRLREKVRYGVERYKPYFRETLIYTYTIIKMKRNPKP